MKLIFGTTNGRKVIDLKNMIKEIGLDIQVLGLKDIGFDDEIEENGKTIEENSLIKAYAIADFCKANDINLPIMTDDAGLFVDDLDGEPGIYTGRYGDDELAKDPTLPKYQCVYKLLRKLDGHDNRNAAYRCCVTTLFPDGSYYQEFGQSDGYIAKEIIGELKKPYFYSVFILSGMTVPFSSLNEEDLKNTYRYEALRKTLGKLDGKK